jgi:hypothetical protein
MIRDIKQIQKRLFLSAFILLFSSRILSQPPQQLIYTYIDAHCEEAVRQMVVYHIPASVILAQAIFESASGTSYLAKRSNNHFGIKCHKEWGGDTIIKSDDVSGECFRSYNTVRDSYTDHSLFLVSRPRYRELFSIPLSDYRAWCRGLKNTGYATYWKYADELIKIIEREQLYLYDSHVQLVSSLPVVEQEITITPMLQERDLKKWCAADIFMIPEAPTSRSASPLLVRIERAISRY